MPLVEADVRKRFGILQKKTDMKRSAGLRSSFLLAAGTVAAASAVAATNKARPNIIFFLVDDMGWQETSVPFWKERTPLNERYRTPAMERLARLGVKFTEAYACSVSSPSRCSLMTGMNAARHRVTNWTLRYDALNDAPSAVLDLPDWNYNGLQPDTVTRAHDLKNTALATPLPQILRDNGYYTIHCGKAHWGAISTAGADPLSFGFDVNIAGGANGAPGSYLARENYGTGDFHVTGLDDYAARGVFLTEALTQEALKAIEVPIARQQPFYLYLSHYAIHAPYKPDDRFTAHYTEADGGGVFDRQLNARLNRQEINHAALVEGMDKSLGDVLDYLEKRPAVAAHTIILFMSDNGGQGVSVRQGRMDYDQNYPARAGKGSAYEGGVREPMLVYWPGVTQGGTVNTNRVMIEDFFPTILDMAEVTQYSCSQRVDGKSFADVLKDSSLRRECTPVWHYPNLWGESQNRAEGYGATSAILKGDYKLIYFWETQELRLYNVREDIGERRNLVAEEPQRVRELARELTERLKDCRAQRPSFKATGKPVPWPAEQVK